VECYDEFALCYDKLMEDVDYKIWVDYINNGILKHSNGVKNVLEMACGTGNLTQYLVKNPWFYSAFDISEQMLSIAREKLIKEHIKWSLQNMIDFHFVELFDLIIAGCDGINYLKDDNEMFMAFKNIRKHLKKDGLFVFDVSTPYKFENQLKDKTIIIDEDDITVIWQNYYNSKKYNIKMDLIFFEKEDNGQYNRYEEQHIQHSNSLDNLKEMLTKAGFDEINVYGDYKFKKASETDERWYFFVK